MKLRNSKERYGIIAMSLHWIVAVLFLLLYISVYFRQWFTQAETDINWTALQLHLSFGMTVMVFVVLRIIYKLIDKKPNEVPGSKFEHLAAKAAHYMLYAVMIIIPITGYTGTGVNTEFFGLFEITQFRETAFYQFLVTDTLGLTWEQFEEPVDFIHKTGSAYFVWVLIAIHIAAALFHHYYKKDNTMRRMLPIKLKQ
jgi:cytochrome b561